MRRLPTTDLYFRNACGGMIGSWRRRAPIRQLGANCFRLADTMILIRRDEDQLMNKVLGWRGRVIYLIDDDIGGAAESPGLPDGYRSRLAAFDQAFHRPLLDCADTILVPSSALADRLGAVSGVASKIRLIDPYWALPLAGRDHFGGIESGRPFHIAHLGSGSHDGALRALAPALLEVLGRHSNVHFTHIGFEAPTPAMESHPRVHRVRTMRWGAYRRWLPRQRFHLAAYPLAQHRFDAARSMNKLLEHAIVGAVGLYTRGWSQADRVKGAHLDAPENPADWGEAIETAIARSHDLGGCAADAATALTPYADPAMQRRLWAELLDIAF